MCCCGFGACCVLFLHVYANFTVLFLAVEDQVNASFGLKYQISGSVNIKLCAHFPLHMNKMANFGFREYFKSTKY